MAKFNKKSFLLPHSEHSMATCHCKVQDNEIYKVTIHDCRNSIQLWGDLSSSEGVEDAKLKLNNLLVSIYDLKEFIEKNYAKN